MESPARAHYLGAEGANLTEHFSIENMVKTKLCSSSSFSLLPENILYCLLKTLALLFIARKYSLLPIEKCGDQALAGSRISIPGFFGTGFPNIFDPGISGKSFGIFRDFHFCFICLSNRIIFINIYHHLRHNHHPPPHYHQIYVRIESILHLKWK